MSSRGLRITLRVRSLFTIDFDSHEKVSVSGAWVRYLIGHEPEGCPVYRICQISSEIFAWGSKIAYPDPQ